MPILPPVVVRMPLDGAFGLVFDSATQGYYLFVNENLTPDEIEKLKLSVMLEIRGGGQASAPPE